MPTLILNLLNTPPRFSAWSFLKFADNKCRKFEDEILKEYEKLKGGRREKALSDIAIDKVVRSAVEEVLDQELPDSYEKLIFKAKCENVFDKVLDYAIQGVRFAA